MARRGEGVRAIAKQLGCSRNTVRRYLREQQVPRLAEERAVMLPAPALKTSPPIAQRVALPVESLQHPLSVYDELLEVA